MRAAPHVCYPIEASHAFEYGVVRPFAAGADGCDNGSHRLCSDPLGSPHERVIGM